MAINNNAVPSSSGGSVNFGTYDYGGDIVVQNVSYMAEGSAIPTVCSLRSFPIRNLKTPDARYTAIQTLLFGGVSEEVLQTDAFIEARNDFYDYAYFIWGSLEAGGCYIRRLTKETYAIGGISGLYLNTDYNEYRYSQLEASRPYVYGTADDLCFMYDADWVTKPNPIIEVFCTDGLEGYYVHDTINAGVGTTNGAEPLNNMAEVVNDVSWVTILTPPSTQPHSFWYATPNLTPPYSISYEILGDREQNPRMVRISGDVWGGENYNPEDTDDDESNENGGNAQNGGGGGGYNPNTGNVGNSNPAGDSVNVINSGFVTLFNPTTQQVKDLNTWLFSDATFTQTLANSVKRLMADPMDFILFLALCRVTPPSSYQEVIKFAGISTSVSANYINNQFVNVNCGSVTVSSKNDLTNTFLDYNPNTKISLFLPYIGIVPMDTDTIVNSTVNVLYICDLMSGSCVAQVKCTRGIRRTGDTNLNDVIYTYQGNIFEMVPLTGTDWRGAISSLMQGIGGAVQLATGNAGGVSTIASAVLSDKVSVSHSGTLAGSYGYMDNQKPYFIITRPVNANPSRYGNWRGYTSNQLVKLSSVSGYTEILPETIWTDNFDGILEGEVDLLKSICSSGIYL